MAHLKIKTFRGNESTPETTVTIPLSVLKFARKLIPNKATEALREQGVDIDQIVELSSDPNVEGTLLEVVQHKKNERVVITLEQHHST